MSESALRLAACIRRAYEGPVFSIVGKWGFGRENPSNDYYWYTREACAMKAKELGLFFPNVISLYEHTTNNMDKGSFGSYLKSSGQKFNIRIFSFRT